MKSHNVLPEAMKSHERAYLERSVEHPTIDISAIQQVGKPPMVDKTAYEKEILNCMILAKEKVQKLASKLQTAKDHITKLSKGRSDKYRNKLG